MSQESEDLFDFPFGRRNRVFETPKTAFRLLDLPAELRAKVFKHLFRGTTVKLRAGHAYDCDENRVWVTWSTKEKTMVNGGAILLVSKQLKVEAGHVIFREATFKLVYTNRLFRDVLVDYFETPTEMDAAVVRMKARRDKDIEGGIGKLFEKLKDVADKIEVLYDYRDIKTIQEDDYDSDAAEMEREMTYGFNHHDAELDRAEAYGFDTVKQLTKHLKVVHRARMDEMFERSRRR